jgi:hypothetical protein
MSHNLQMPVIKNFDGRKIGYFLSEPEDTNKHLWWKYLENS